MYPIHTILHPTDFSEPSEFAYKLACALARDYHARMVIMHVVTVPTAIYAEAGLLPQTEDRKSELDVKLRRILPGPEISFEHRLREGDPATEIVDTAKDVNANLIVMGTHGRTGLGRLLMGSVAEHVLRKASCPVLTVRTKVEEEPEGG